MFRLFLNITFFHSKIPHKYINNKKCFSIGSSGFDNILNSTLHFVANNSIHFFRADLNWNIHFIHVEVNRNVLKTRWKSEQSQIFHLINHRGSIKSKIFLYQVHTYITKASRMTMKIFLYQVCCYIIQFCVWRPYEEYMTSLFLLVFWLLHDSMARKKYFNVPRHKLFKNKRYIHSVLQKTNNTSLIVVLVRYN